MTDRRAPRVHPNVLFGWGALLALALEAGVRLALPAGSHVQGQRLGEAHGFVALGLLALVLLAQPAWTRPYRRPLGLLAFAFALLHTAYSFQFDLDGRLDSLAFLAVGTRNGVLVGALSLALLVPLALTSSRPAQRALGRHWRTLHRLTPPAFVLAGVHTAWVGVHAGLTPLTVGGVLVTLATLVTLVGRAVGARRARVHSPRRTS
ncbi:ferric reductase-like transmembrane domain-containing protein [Deinococcus maricopensis]|uniref:Ferric reductase domain protein transmembrane component domain protein n=1 Tax=Deinococcus maricopensis (strain DSM 21211 / LMG 22137 / NRRL B-23946 / LB-34) TaxID=709986 RepID=E8UAZ3_DEIML|nr:ferric reductase-like transmembrane domain-containing protein [Deinococcus maricopensis]ADV68232.1 Ferric reductase domain protein transmembrane component domain protein [Deinococcus maricopensis DSM 21211]